MRCFFVSDLHGNKGKYEALFKIVSDEEPDAVLLGGDLLPTHTSLNIEKFMRDVILTGMKNITREHSVRFLAIMGNDDPRKYEDLFKEADSENILDYMHFRTISLDDVFITGYSYVPPTPFQLKDWERYDVSRFTDVGSVSPELGFRTMDVPENEIKHGTIEKDLKELKKNSPPEYTIYLFHSPPYKMLDMVDWRGQIFGHVKPDINVGSIAIRKFIESEHPLVTLHGHIHEAAARTGTWRLHYSGTHCFTAAHGGPELSLVRFDTDELEKATREIIKIG